MAANLLTLVDSKGSAVSSIDCCTAVDVVGCSARSVDVAKALAFIGTMGKLKTLKRAGWIQHGMVCFVGGTSSVKY
jgi:hypothetical protein